MKKIVVLFAVMATMILFGSNSAYAEGCNDLTIEVYSNEWNVIGDLRCHHGKIARSATREVTVTAIGLYGPDCRIGFENVNTKVQALVNFQQNYCGMAAGDITVEQISGPQPIYTKETGSFASERGGKVTITGFK